MTDTHPAGSWAADDFVDRWIAHDSMAAILELPMRVSAALVQESGIRVRRVVDVGSGPGTYLRILLEEFPDAEGTWIREDETMEDAIISGITHTMDEAYVTLTGGNQ